MGVDKSFSCTYFCTETEADQEADHMSYVSYTAFRERLADYMDEVCNDSTSIHVTRQGARSVVVMSEAEYESLLETVHLLRSPANTRRLLAAIADANAGKLTEFRP